MPTYNVENEGNLNYLWSGEEFGTDQFPDPNLTFVAGETYTINIDAAGYPFFIKTQPTSGTSDQFNDGVTGNGTQNGTLTFDVPFDAPHILYYAASTTTNMQGRIDVTGTLTESYILFGPSSGTVNEGEAFTVVLDTANVADGTDVFYRITGITSEDLEQGTLEGNFTVTGNQAQLSFKLAADLTTEPLEIITLGLPNVSAEPLELFVNDTSQDPTYNLSVDVNEVDEGGTINVTLDTTEFPDNSNIAYTITGVGPNDLTSGTTTGVFTIQNNTATESFTFVEDVSSEEGDETFTLTLDDTGDSVSVTVRDTSTDQVVIDYNVTALDALNYIFTGGEFGQTETEDPNLNLIAGDLYNFNVSVPGQPFYIKASQTIGTGDQFTDGVTNNGAESGTVSFEVPADAPDTLFYISGNSADMTGVITITGNTPATYSLTGPSEVNEGDTFTINLNSTDVADGTEVAYTITGVSTLDINSEPLTGTFTITDNFASKTFTVSEDLTTENDETFLLSLNNGLDDISVLIKDTSTTPIKSYDLSTSTTIVNEGGTVVVTLITENVADGEFVPYDVSGISLTDLTAGSDGLSGAFQVFDNEAQLTFIFREDDLTEGLEVMTVSLQNEEASISVLVNDTSQAPDVTYALIANPESVDEPGTLTVTLNTTNVPNGIEIPYTATGLQPEDITSGNFTGNFVIENNSADIIFEIAEDYIPEGPETLTVALDNGEASIDVTVNDTSFEPAPDATYTLSAGNLTSINEDTGFFIDLQTTKVGQNTEIPYTITGINEEDLVIEDSPTGGNGLTGNFVVVDNQAELFFEIAADETVEGPEFLTLTLDNGQASITIPINDTSVPNIPPEAIYNLFVDFDTYVEGQTVRFYLETQNVPSGAAVPFTIETSNSPTEVIPPNVTEIFVTKGGSGYDANNPPAVTISGGGGSGATAQAIVDSQGGFVSSITVNQTGSGYTSVPTVDIAPPSDPEGTQAEAVAKTQLNLQTLTGQFILDNDGKSSFSLATIKDSSFLEGTDTLTLTLDEDNTQSVTVSILDTSISDDLEESQPPTVDEIITLLTPTTSFPKYFVTTALNADDRTVFSFTGEEFNQTPTINPQITLDRGKTYEFVVNAIGAPFTIKTSDTAGFNTSTRFNDGVTNQNVEKGVLTFQVPENAPDTLYYRSEIQQFAVGEINVVGTVEEGELADRIPTRNPFQSYVQFSSNGTFDSGTTYVVENRQTQAFYFTQGEFFYGIENPTLYLVRGNTYEFRVFGLNHILYIKTEPVTGFGSLFNTGVTNNGIEEGTLVFEVPLTAPDTLYYQCGYHSPMGGEIKIFDRGADIPERNPYHNEQSDIPPQITPEGNLVRQELSNQEVKFQQLQGNLTGKRIKGRKTTVANYNGYFPKFVQVQPEPYKEELKDQYEIILSEDQFEKYPSDAVLYEPIEYRFWFENPFLVVPEGNQQKVFYLTKESINIDNLYRLYWNNDAIYFDDETTFAYLFFWNEDEVTLDDERVTFN